MNDLTTIFPSETIQLILAYLDKKDQLECMRVCKHWMESIPIYVSAIRVHLFIVSRVWPKTNDCFLRCLGPHIKNAYIDDLPTCSVLRKLKDRDCNITTLDIKCHQSSVKYGQDLILAITLFGNTLKEVQITNIVTLKISEHTLLNNCPNLTHLTFLFVNPGKDAPHPLLASKTKDCRRTDANLIYLHLDSEMSFENRTTAILRRCPKLKSSIVTKHGQQPLHYTHLSATQFNFVFELCPRLRYVSWNENNDNVDNIPLYRSWKRCVGKAEHKKDPNAKGLDGLVFHGTIEEVLKITPLLERAQHNLGYLKLWGIENGTAPVDGLQFTRLKTLTLGYLKPDQNRWVPFFIGCQNLESLTLHISLTSTDLIGIFKGIHCLKSLRHLCLSCAGVNMNDHQFPGMFKMLSTSNIQTLVIREVPICDQGLLDICDILSLRKLDLTMQKYEYRITTAGLLSFAKKLSSINGQLHTLKLAWFANLTDTVLRQFAQVKSLTTLTVSFSGEITHAGVEAFVNNNKKIITSFCPLFSNVFG